MPSRFLALLIVGILTAMPVRSASAQTIDSTLVARYQLAETYLRSAQFDRAIGMFEDLVTRSPQTPLFADRLRYAYESVKRYDDAIALVDGQLRTSGPSVSLFSERARLLFLKGDEDDAYTAWDSAVQTAADQPGAYQAVYRSMMRMRLFERSIGVLETARVRLDNPALFQADLANLYGLTGRHVDAMTEYLAILSINERQIDYVRDRLSQNVEQAGMLDESISAVEQAVRSEPLYRPYRELLAWLYLEAGEYRAAFDANRAIDRLENEQGQVLYAFAQQASDAEAWSVALDAYSEILERYPISAAAADARAALGLLYEKEAQAVALGTQTDSSRAAVDELYSQALEAYETFITSYPGHPGQPEARYRIARIHQEVLFDLVAADAALREVLVRHPASAAADRAAFDLGRLELARDELDAARLQFSRLADKLRTGELAEAARLELALIHYYRGEFDAAAALTESMKENTAADVSNDAIGLKLLLMENRGPDSSDTALRGFARMQLLKRQRSIEAARIAADSLMAGLNEHALLDDLVFERADLLVQEGRVEEGVAAFLEFHLAYPDSPLADRSLFRGAELQAERLGDPAAAAQSYDRLLATFPGSLLASEARSRIRRLRGDGT